MKLFEGGILDKITNDEYEKMFQSMQVTAVKTSLDENVPPSESDDKSPNTNPTMSNSKPATSKISNEKELTALSLQMLQGAFYLVLIGYFLAFCALIFEIGSHRYKIDARLALTSLSNRLHTWIMRINRFRLSK